MTAGLGGVFSNAFSDHPVCPEPLCCPSLTSHLDVQWIQARRVHLDDHLVGVVDDGEAGVLSEPQDVIAAIFVDDPGGHDGGAHATDTELPFLRAAAPPGARGDTRRVTEAKERRSE